MFNSYLCTYDLYGPVSNVWLYILIYQDGMLEQPRNGIEPLDECHLGSGGQNDDFRPLTSTLGGEGHGVQGQICDNLRPQLAMNRILPLWPRRFPHFGYIHLGGGGVGGGL
jgi:hypothetical protein